MTTIDSKALEAVKAVATGFFRWWWNSPGTNTDQGFDEWVVGPGAAAITAYLSALPSPKVEEEPAAWLYRMWKTEDWAISFDVDQMAPFVAEFPTWQVWPLYDAPSPVAADKARLDWLEMQSVSVISLIGSSWYATPPNISSGNPSGPSDLRAQIDIASLPTPPAVTP